MGLFGKSDREIGRDGPLDKIRTRAGQNCDYNKKLNLVAGCIEAFENGRPQHLQAFLDAYFDFRRNQGTLERPLNNGLRYLVAEPVLDILEKSKEPHKAIAEITAAMSDHYRSIALKIAFLRASEENRWPSAKDALEDSVSDGAGYDGTIERVRKKALADGPYTSKLKLLDGCLRAFDEGRPENLRAFVGAYLEFKRKNGNLAKLGKEEVDEGFIKLISAPLLGLIEKSRNPVETAQEIVADLSDFYKQVVLDLILREACGPAGSWYVAQAVLEAGADPNADGGRPVFNALREDNARILEILGRSGADLVTVPAFAGADYAERISALRQKLSGAAVFETRDRIAAARHTGEEDEMPSPALPAAVPAAEPPRRPRL